MLSLALIVKNEARWLPDLLASHAGLADEVVVVDTGSTDDTVEIARAAGARVEQRPWPGSFAEARNAALDLCREDWVLVLDADERLDADGGAQLRAAMSSGQAEVYRLVQRTYSDDPELLDWVPATDREASRGRSGYYDVRIGRLFRRRPELRFEGLIHELVEPSARRAGLAVRDLEVVIHHYKEEQSPERQRAKTALYLELSRRKLADDPSSAQARLELGMAALVAGAPEEAVAALAPALAAHPDSLTLAGHLAAALLDAGRSEEVGRALGPTLERSSGQARARLLGLVGEAALRSGKVNAACAVLQEALSLNPDDYRGLVNLGAAFVTRQRFEEAVPWLERAHERCPAAELLLLNLGICHARAGRGDVAKALLDRALAIRPDRWQTHAQLAGIAFDRGDFRGAAEHAARARVIEGCGADAYVRGCAAALALGRAAEALELARGAAELDPRHASVVQSLLVTS